jgi:hypothetical protein
MKYTRFPWLVLTWCLVITQPLLGQEPSCQRRVLPVSVADRNGAPIRDLTVADFQAEFRGKPARILSLAPDTRPRRLVILLDASGSMAAGEGDRPWNLARVLVSNIAATRMRNTSVAVLIFGDKIYEQHDFSQNSEMIADRLREIVSDPAYVKKEVRGRTALLDTIMAALHMLAPPRSDDVIYAITDGGDNSSHIRWDQVKRGLLSSGVRLYASVITPDLGRGRTPEELNGPSDLRALADATGGLIFESIVPPPIGIVRHKLDEKGRKALNANLLRLYQLMLENYLLEVEIPVPVDKWRRWKLEISKEKRRQFKEAAVGYPRELGLCNQQLATK